MQEAFQNICVQRNGTMEKNVLQVGLIGAGRIGKIHAASVGGHPATTLHSVFDVYEPAAKEVAEAYGATVAPVETILNNQDIDLIMICSSTDTHADLIEQSARAGKAIFCEKPIDLSMERVRGVLDVVASTGARLMLGFNRRFDPNFMALEHALRSGDVGEPEIVTITSRDPGPPPAEYIEVSGGLFRDMMIHDFDMARWLLDEEPVRVYATAAALTDPGIGALGDVDTAVVTLTCASGRMAVITNSRRATYGYDQRIEVHGSKGMLRADNVLEHTITRADNTGQTVAKPLHFFLERYAAAYRNELDALVKALQSGVAAGPDGRDGAGALALADAALQSLQTGQPVTIS